MADKIKIVSPRSLLWFFAMTSAMFLLSWFFVLRSTTPPRFVDFDVFPSSKLHSNIKNSTFETHQNNNPPPVEPSIGNRAILANHEKVEQQQEDKCSSNTNDNLPLKVFMYDLPPEFHFELLDWKTQGDSVWPDITTQMPHYPGGLNLQHSIEYWLTLDLLASELPQPPNAKPAIRVRNVSEADIIFVPFFSSLSYNRYSKTDKHEKKSKNKLLEEKIVKFLRDQEEWKRSGGMDHLILAHHPNSMLSARTRLWPATFILSDFGRYPPNIANVGKDVIAPYKHVVKSYENDSSDFDSRPTLLYFQGAISRKDVCDIVKIGSSVIDSSESLSETKPLPYREIQRSQIQKIHIGYCDSDLLICDSSPLI